MHGKAHGYTLSSDGQRPRRYNELYSGTVTQKPHQAPTSTMTHILDLSLEYTKTKLGVILRQKAPSDGHSKTQGHLKRDLHRHTRPHDCLRENGGSEARDADEHIPVWENPGSISEASQAPSPPHPGFWGRKVKTPPLSSPASRSPILSAVLEGSAGFLDSSPLLVQLGESAGPHIQTSRAEDRAQANEKN